MTELNTLINSQNSRQRHFVTKSQLDLWRYNTNEDEQMELWLNKFKDSNSYVSL